MKDFFFSNFIKIKGKAIMTFKFILKSLESKSLEKGSFRKFKLCIFHPNMLSGLLHMCRDTHKHGINLSGYICLIYGNENRIVHNKKTLGV